MPIKCLTKSGYSAKGHCTREAAFEVVENKHFGSTRFQPCSWNSAQHRVGTEYLLNGSLNGQILALPFVHWVASEPLHPLFSLPETTFLQISSLGFCSNAFLQRGLRRKPKWNGTLALPFLLPIYTSSLSHFSPSTTLHSSPPAETYAQEQGLCFICFCVPTQNSICMNESWRILVCLLFLIHKANGVAKSTNAF